jgi:hypothetical protein
MPDREIKGQHHPAKSFFKSPLSLYFLAPSCLSGYKSILQNKPNFVRDTTNATLSTACHSDRRHACSVPKRRNLLQHSRYLPNSLLRPACHAIVTCIMQNKPNFPRAKMPLNPCPEKHYGNTSSLRPRQNKPNQSQFITAKPDPALTQTATLAQIPPRPLHASRDTTSAPPLHASRFTRYEI